MWHLRASMALVLVLAGTGNTAPSRRSESHVLARWDVQTVAVPDVVDFTKARLHARSPASSGTGAGGSKRPDGSGSQDDQSKKRKSAGPPTGAPPLLLGPTRKTTLSTPGYERYAKSHTSPDSLAFGLSSQSSSKAKTKSKPKSAVQLPPPPPLRGHQPKTVKSAGYAKFAQSLGRAPSAPRSQPGRWPDGRFKAETSSQPTQPSSSAWPALQQASFPPAASTPTVIAAPSRSVRPLLSPAPQPYFPSSGPPSPGESTGAFVDSLFAPSPTHSRTPSPSASRNPSPRGSPSW